jgi:2-keto-4-pentenoate hydratase
MAAHDPQPGSYASGGTDDERERLVAQATLFDRGWARYGVLAEAIRSLLPAIEATGLATAAEVDPDTLADRLRAAVVATGGVAASPPLIGAWARVR